MEERKPPSSPNEPPERPEGPPPPRWNQRSWFWFVMFVLLAWSTFHFLGNQLGDGTARVTVNTFLDEVRGVESVREGVVDRLEENPIAGQSRQRRGRAELESSRDESRCARS